ncbi:helix-turn-helix domain-containing protein [Amycolatopsis sp. NPDC054798]
MSNEAQGLVRNLPLSAPHKPILMAYANYADESGYCWPSVEVIAFDSGFSEPTVKRARRELIADGWMGTKRRFGTSAATRLNLPKIAEAGVDRGDRTRLNHDIEFEPDAKKPAGQKLRDQSDPNVRSGTPKSRKPAGRSRRDHSDPNGARSDQSDPNEGITVIRTRDQSDPLSLTDPLLDPSLLEDRDAAEGEREGATSSAEKTPPADWALELVAGLDFGAHARPTRTEALGLAAQVEAAVAEHGLTRGEVLRHCRAKLAGATRSGVSFLAGGLEPDRLPLPTPKRKSAVQEAHQDPLSSDDLTAEDLLARGFTLKTLPKRFLGNGSHLDAEASSEASRVRGRR